MIKWRPFSKRQLQLLTWWTENSPYRNSNGIIAEGAIRSGKTVIMSFSFILWAMNAASDSNFALCGKTVGALRRNVITPLKEILLARGIKIIDRKTENLLIITCGKATNRFYLFGGRDERSQDLIQGLTLNGILFDEVALMPRSFVEQGLGRCSKENSKYWFNCNPESPYHWFYLEHVLKAQERKYLRLHFNLEDNPSLSQEVIDKYKSMFTGLFYKRFILGEWAFSDGIIYDSFDEERNTYNEDNKRSVVPYQILENDMDGGYFWIAADYGVRNPMVYLECYRIRKPGDPVPYFYVENEYYYESKSEFKQKTDAQYVDDLLNFINGRYYKALIIDPSASSLIAACMQEGIRTIKADNDVDDGIRMVYSLFATGHLLINKDKCPNLIKEIGLYVWDARSEERGQEKPVKLNDHALDALRYFVKTTTPLRAVIA